VTGEARSSIFADVPTVAESGVPGYAAVIHYGMVRRPYQPHHRGRLNAELRAALGSEDVRARIAEEAASRSRDAGPAGRGFAGRGGEVGALVRKLGIRSE